MVKIGYIVVGFNLGSAFADLLFRNGHGFSRGQDIFHTFLGILLLYILEL